MDNHSAGSVDRRFLLGAAGLAGIAALSAGRAKAGPLNPPAGAVASSAKPLSEVEPRTALSATNTPGTATAVYRITAPGSYYLTGAIATPEGKSAVEIASNGVTLDLCGFDVLGPLSGAAVSGITANGRVGITVRNGSVRDFVGGGVVLSGCQGCLVENIMAIGNQGGGITVGDANIVRACAANGNALSGLVFGANCTVSDCVAMFNADAGLSCTGASAVSRCSAASNGGPGFKLVGGVLSDSSSVSNAQGVSGGSSTPNGLLVERCIVRVNNGLGISAGINSAVRNCTVHGNAGNGITAGVGLVVSGCSVRGNTFTAVNATDEALIESSEVCSNNSVGVFVGARCVVRNCLLSTNGGSGQANLAVVGADGRIEGNTLLNASVGLSCTSAGNFITRNTASGNATNWAVAAGNICLVVSAATAGVVSGNAGGTAPGSTDPNANFTY